MIHETEFSCINESFLCVPVHRKEIWLSNKCDPTERKKWNMQKKKINTNWVQHLVILNTLNWNIDFDKHWLLNFCQISLVRISYKTYILLKSNRFRLVFLLSSSFILSKNIGLRYNCLMRAISLLLLLFYSSNNRKLRSFIQTARQKLYIYIFIFVILCVHLSFFFFYFFWVFV